MCEVRSLDLGRVHIVCGASFALALVPKNERASGQKGLSLARASLRWALCEWENLHRHEEHSGCARQSCPVRMESRPPQTSMGEETQTFGLGLREAQVEKPMTAKWKAGFDLKTRRRERGAECCTSSLALQKLGSVEEPAVVAVVTLPEA